MFVNNPATIYQSPVSTLNSGLMYFKFSAVSLVSENKFYHSV